MDRQREYSRQAGRQAGRQADRTKLIVTLHNFVNVPTTVIIF
jgi:hypothetical protein